MFCPKPIKGVALRLTRNDVCDVPLAANVANSRIQTSGFVRLAMTPDYDEGDEITLRNANGDLCLHESPDPVLRGMTLELQLCGVPYPVLEMLAGYDALVNANADIIGLAAPIALRNTNRNSATLEVWQRNAGSICTTPGTDEVQTVTVTATGGTFTLSFGGSTTAALAFNAAAATVRAALEALPSIGGGNVTVTGGPGGTAAYTVTFSDELGNVEQMTANGAALTGTAPSVTVATTTQGAAPPDRFIQHALPKTRKWRLTSELVIADATVLDVTLSGYAERNPRWVAPVASEWLAGNVTSIAEGRPWASQYTGVTPRDLDDCNYQPAAA